MDAGLFDAAMVAASLAAAGAMGGLVGGMLRVGGGIVLLPAILALLPQSPALLAMPALAVAASANLALSALATIRRQRASGPKPGVTFDRSMLAWGGGGVIVGLLVILAPTAGVSIIALAMILAGAVMMAPAPRALTVLTGRTRQIGEVALATLSGLVGAGGGTFGAMVKQRDAEQSAACGVALGLPVVLLVWIAAIHRTDVTFWWMAAPLLVAGAAYLAAPFGTRLAPTVPGAPLRLGVGLGVVIAGFSLLRASV